MMRRDWSPRESNFKSSTANMRTADGNCAFQFAFNFAPSFSCSPLVSLASAQRAFSQHSPHLVLSIDAVITIPLMCPLPFCSLHDAVLLLSRFCTWRHFCFIPFAFSRALDISNPRAISLLFRFPYTLHCQPIARSALICNSDAQNIRREEIFVLLAKRGREADHD